MKLMAVGLVLVLSMSSLASAQESDMRFDLFGEDKHESAEDKARAEQQTLALERKVRRRRSMLTWHQGLGFATLGLLATTLVIGQLNYQDKFSPDGEYTGRYNNVHLDLSVASSGLFAVTGMLALFAPNPYPKPIKVDAALLHKVSMAAATACFLAQIVLGPISISKEGSLAQRPLAQAHLAVGYASFAFMATGTIAYLAK
jgi:hypothetical protein